LAWTSFLRYPSLYIAVQKALRADALRRLCISKLALEKGNRVLDIGCGPADYLEDLRDVEYHGFDTAPQYIEHARQRFGDRGHFYCEVYAEHHVAALAPFDRVMLMGLLHHLDDAACDDLLGLIARSLASGGRVVTLDTCFEEQRPFLRTFIAKRDRGEYVRVPRQYEALARPHFTRVSGFHANDICRIPISEWIMVLEDPTAQRK